MGKHWLFARTMLRTIYNDRFCWSFIKSYAIFFFAVGLAKTIRL